MFIRRIRWALTAAVLMSLATEARAQETEMETPGEEAVPAASDDPVMEVAAEVDVSEPEAEAEATEPEPETASEPARVQLAAIQIGFAHWFGDTFGAPIGAFTPALAASIVPIDWLELQLAYSISVVGLPMPDGTNSNVGFLTLALMLRHELRIEGERLSLGGGLLGGIVHTGGGVRGALGVVIVTRYLVQVIDELSIGPFIDARVVFYEIAESPNPLFEISDGVFTAGHADAHIQVGVALAF